MLTNEGNTTPNTAGAGGYPIIKWSTTYATSRGIVAKPNAIMVAIGDKLKDLIKKEIRSHVLDRDWITEDLFGGELGAGPGGFQWEGRGNLGGGGFEAEVFIGSNLYIGDDMKIENDRNWSCGFALNWGWGAQNPGAAGLPPGWNNGRYWDWGARNHLWDGWCDDWENMDPFEQEPILEEMKQGLVESLGAHAGHYIMYDCGTANQFKQWFGPTVHFRPCTPHYHPHDPNKPCPPGTERNWYEAMKDTVYIEELENGPYIPLELGPTGDGVRDRSDALEWAELDSYLEEVRGAGDSLADINWGLPGGDGNSNLIISNQGGNTGPQSALGGGDMRRHGWNTDYSDWSKIIQRTIAKKRRMSDLIHPHMPAIFEFDPWMIGFLELQKTDEAHNILNDRNPLSKYYKPRDAFGVPKYAFPAGTWPGGNHFFEVLGLDPNGYLADVTTNVWTGSHNAKDWKP